MWRGGIGYRDREELKLSGISASIVYNLSVMTYILPESDWYAENFMCGWYAKQAPGSRKNL